MNLSDRIALFNSGQLEQVGTPEALYQAPDTLFAAAFLGDSNVFELADGVRERAVWEDNSWAVPGGTVSSRVHPGGPAVLVVRPEDVHIAAGPDVVPSGANQVSATLRHLEYMGSYRTAVLSMGRGGLPGRARLAALDVELVPGQDVVAWWETDRQRVVHP